MSCQSEAETLTKQMKEKLPASDKIPDKLMQVIWKATEKDQSKRYQTALDFKQAIQNALIPDPPLSERISDWIQEHVLLVILGSVGIAAIIFVIILLLM